MSFLRSKELADKRTLVWSPNPLKIIDGLEVKVAKQLVKSQLPEFFSENQELLFHSCGFYNYGFQQLLDPKIVIYRQFITLCDDQGDPIARDMKSLNELQDQIKSFLIYGVFLPIERFDENGDENVILKSNLPLAVTSETNYDQVKEAWETMLYAVLSGQTLEQTLTSVHLGPLNLNFDTLESKHIMTMNIVNPTQKRAKKFIEFFVELNDWIQNNQHALYGIVSDFLVAYLHSAATTRSVHASTLHDNTYFRAAESKLENLKKPYSEILKYFKPLN